MLLNSPVRAVTQGPAHHFFGYYDRCPWDASGRFLLAQRSDFMDRRPRADDELTIGMLDLREENCFIPLAQTRAWNWQQGCQLRWLSEREIVFNARAENHFHAVVMDVFSGARRELPLPVYAVAPDGKQSLHLNFSRAYDIRAGYGYAGVPDPWREVPAPDDAGIWWQNLENGDNRLLISIHQVAQFGSVKAPAEAKHWLDHLQWNPDGSRFLFLHRWGVPRAGAGAWWQTRLFTAAADGGDLRCLSDHGMVSHFDWRDSSHILAWAHRCGIGDCYFLFDDDSEHIESVGEGILSVDGHCSYSPDGQWLLTDTYPDRQGDKTLILWNPAQQKRLDIGKFHGPIPADPEIRCDLHPRWSRDGKLVCIDSIHQGSRQMYVVDVAAVVA